LLVVASLVGSSALGCSSDPTGADTTSGTATSHGLAKNDDGRERTDLEPLTMRFEAIPDVVERLVEHLPTGPMSTSGELCLYTDGASFDGEAFIAVNSDQLVITKLEGPR